MIRIREARKQKKITAKELAEAVNVAESTMSLYENGKREPDFDTLLKISKYLDTSIDRLLDNDIKEEIPAAETAAGAEILKMFNSLSPEKQKQFRDYLRFLLTSPEI